MKLTLEAAAQDLAVIDLGESDAGYLDGEDLSPTGGNLYLNIDGKEWGSLFFYVGDDGKLAITLGQFDHEQQEWVERNPLTHPVLDPNNPAIVEDYLSGGGSNA